MTAPTPNAELAYRVLDHIDAHPDQHDQGRWFRKTACGTAGCFAGWTVALAGHRIEFDTELDEDGNQNYDTIDGSRDVSVSGVAVEDLGIAAATVKCRLCGDCGHRDRADDALFSGSNTREDLGRLVEEIFGPRPVKLPRYMMATTAMHKLGDISRDEPDLAWITDEDGDDWIGAWVAGYGYIHVRFPKATTRGLTAEERAHYDGKVLALGNEPVGRIEFDDVPPNAGSAS